MHAEGGVLEEAAPFPSEEEMQRRGEQYNVGKRDRLRERREPIVEPFTRCLARQLRPLRRHLSPKQPIYGSIWAIVVSTEWPRRTTAGAMLMVTDPKFQVTINPEDDISA